MELAYDPEKSPSRWLALSPAYFVTAPPWVFAKLERILIPDAMRAAAPVVVIYIMLHVQTRQPLLAFAAVFVILFAIALSLLVFGAVVGGTWLSVYAYPALYITVGVGVDDIFVMTQAWMLCPQESARARLVETYRTAGEMMLATTLTSCSAFLATALLSPMMAMQCLGYITAASLLFDYLLVLTLYAACLVLCHERTRPAFPPIIRADDAASTNTSTTNPPPTDTSSTLDESSEGTSMRTSPAAAARQMFSLAAAHGLDVAKGWGPWDVATAWSARQAKVLRFRRPIMGCFTLVLLPFVIWQFREGLTIDSLPPSFLPSSHPLQRSYFDNNDFATSPLDVFDTVHMMWGLSPGALDLRGVNRLRNKGFQGKPMLDDHFRLDSAAQLHLLRACTLLRSSDLVPVFSANLASEAALEKAVHCWPEAFQSFVERSGLAFPIDDVARAEELLLAWLGEEVGLDEVRGAELAQDIGFINTDITRGDASGTWSEITGQGERGASSRVLQFVKLRASTTIKTAFPPPYWQLEVQYRGWQQLVAQVNTDAPPSAAHAIQVIVSLPGAPDSDLNNKWIQVSMHLAYMSLTASGLGIGLAVCLPVLLLSTRSWPISAIAATCLVFVILGVLASMLACGWKIGMVEALCLIIVSGLSVDPVLHIASAFSQGSARLSPLARAQQAVQRMGPPLLASAITTLASALSLSACQLTLLSKIGLFMIFSTIWSLGTSVTLLPALLATFGPASCGCSKASAASAPPRSRAALAPSETSQWMTIERVSENGL